MFYEYEDSDIENYASVTICAPDTDTLIFAVHI